MTASWTAREAVALEDFDVVDAVVGNARVIGFAEYEHQQPECLALRNRLFQHLVKSKGVTAIAAETSFLKSIAVDDYVLGRRPHLTSEIVHAVFSWSPHASEENRQLIEWMRKYNQASVSRTPLRFYGIDLTGVRPGLDPYEHAREAADIALSFAARFDPHLAGEIGRRVNSGLSRFTPSRYDTLSTTEKDSLTAALHDLEGLFDRRSSEWVSQASPLEYWRAYRSLRVALQHDADLREEAHAGSVAREAALAENLRAVLEQEGSLGRVFLFASSSHLTKGHNSYFHDQQLGARLAAMWEGNYVAIGTFWLTDRSEPDEQPLRAIAARLVHPLSFLDMQPGSGVAWMSRGDPRTPSFDALIFMQVRERALRW